MKKIFVFLIVLFLIFTFMSTAFLYNNKSDNNNCNFIRTYKILHIEESNDDEFLYITIRAFQDEEVQTIKILKNINDNITVGKYYEFEFNLHKKIDEDDILSIYNNSNIISIKETNKTGLEQIQENIC